MGAGEVSQSCGVVAAYPALHLQSSTDSEPPSAKDCGGQEVRTFPPGHVYPSGHGRQESGSGPYH